MEKLFREVRDLIADRNFKELSRLDIRKPEKFNWAKDIFEGIHVKETPDAIALLWTDGNAVNRYSLKRSAIYPVSC